MVKQMSYVSPLLRSQSQSTRNPPGRASLMRVVTKLDQMDFFFSAVVPLSWISISEGRGIANTGIFRIKPLVVSYMYSQLHLASSRLCVECPTELDANRSLELPPDMSTLLHGICNKPLAYPVLLYFQELEVNLSSQVT